MERKQYVKPKTKVYKIEDRIMPFAASTLHHGVGHNNAEHGNEDEFYDSNSHFFDWEREDAALPSNVW